MLIREAVKLAGGAKISGTKKVALVCSFEPLHLKTYIQAFLAQQFSQETPAVVSFGYDQLRSALKQTASELNSSPALLFLSWEDLHPALSWRTRGPLGKLSKKELSETTKKLRTLLLAWVKTRKGETYVVGPPAGWLPLHDPVSPAAQGETSLAGLKLMHDLLGELGQKGARILKTPGGALSYRDLLQSGCPLTPESSEEISAGFVGAAFPTEPRKKAIIVDLDGTLWDGIIGEDGAERINHRPEGKGYPFHVFQKFLKKLKNEGIFLALCSKNNPSDVLPVFDSFKMPLSLADFSTQRLNWEPKSGNIRSIAQELNIGLDSLIVIDDNESELAEIRESLPEVSLLHVPQEGHEWLELLSRLQDLCATWRLTREDAIRTETKTAARRKEALQKAPRHAEDPAHWSHLKDLHLEIDFNDDASSDPRSFELINKTNQFNLTGERLTPEEWRAWASRPGVFCCSARLKDRFGDFGTICVATGRAESDCSLTLRQMVLSCRAFGRGVEETILMHLAESHSSPAVKGPYKDTGKNEPVRRFLERMGYKPEGVGTWTLMRPVIEAAAHTFREQSGARVGADSGGPKRKHNANV